MTTLTFQRVSRWTNESYPMLCIDFLEPGVPQANLCTEARRWNYGRGFDVVALGAGFEDLVSWQHPDGRILRDVTDDPEIVAFVEEWLTELNDSSGKHDERNQGNSE